MSYEVDVVECGADYTFRGGNSQLFSSKEPEVVLAGAAETGKTVACCLKSHLIALKYPGSQGALVRKVGADIPGTVFLTMKRILSGAPVEVYGGMNKPEKIIYSNGSTIWIGGMDKPGKTLSGERDFIQVCQAEELALDDWEIMTTRTTGRGAVYKHPQIFGDCNPAGSRHWIIQRSKEGKLKLLQTFHTDNPTLYDERGQLTEQGKRTLERLGNLTGVRRQRLLLGQWATAEGVVYDTFDANVHVKHRDEKEFVEWYLTCDEGYTNPAVILLVGVDGDGRWYIAREFYERGVLQTRFVNEVKDRQIEKNVSLVAVDESAAGLIADMQDNGINAVAAKGRVLDGIQKIQDRLKVQNDGRPRLTIDPSCVNTINEFESYVWKKSKDGTGKDEPVKENDHAMDAIRYLEDALNHGDYNVGEIKLF